MLEAAGSTSAATTQPPGTGEDDKEQRVARSLSWMRRPV